MREQLGREPTTPFAVVARCPGGHPLVIRNHPLDAMGRPFPTLYWLTCPEAVRRVSGLESEGWIDRLERQFDEDAIGSVRELYAQERGEQLPEARGWGGVGGTRRGLKCLHAHAAFALARPGYELGDRILAEVPSLWPVSCCTPVDDA